MIALLSKEYIRLVVLASVIAFPLAVWATAQWLMEFAYPVHMHGWIYGLAALAALLLTVATVGVYALKSAMTNPANNLRAE